MSSDEGDFIDIWLADQVLQHPGGAACCSLGRYQR